jgi:hypothetical protein
MEAAVDRLAGINQTFTWLVVDSRAARIPARRQQS